MNIGEGAAESLSLACLQEQSCNGADFHCLSSDGDSCSVNCDGNDRCDMTISMNPYYVTILNDHLSNLSDMCSYGSCNNVIFDCGSGWITVYFKSWKIGSIFCLFSIRYIYVSDKIYSCGKMAFYSEYKDLKFGIFKVFFDDRLAIIWKYLF